MIRTYSPNAILAKSRAMYANRLTPENYTDMLSCKNVSEIAVYLKNNTHYGQVLENANLREMYRFRLENLLQQKLFEQYARLCKYEFAIGAELYKFFIIQKDVKQIFNCLKLINSGKTEDFILKIPVFIDNQTELDYIEFAKIKSFKELLALLENTEYKAVLEPYANNYSEYGSTVNIEADLINHKYKKLLSMTKNKEIPNLFAPRCDVRAIINLCRLLRISVTDKLLTEKMFIDGLSGFGKKQRSALINAKNEAEIKAVLETTSYGRQFEFEALGEFEDKSREFLYKWHLRRLRYSTSPDVVMFCYLYLAEDEINNIIHIIEGVRYGMPPDEIKVLITGY